MLPPAAVDLQCTASRMLHYLRLDCGWIGSFFVTLSVVLLDSWHNYFHRSYSRTSKQDRTSRGQQLTTHDFLPREVPHAT